MKKAFVYYMSFLILLSSFLFTIHAVDMVLTTPEGVNIVLHDDNTWDFEDRTNEDFEEDFHITLDDNRIILITAYGEWRFVDKAALKKKEVLPVNKVVASGTGKSIDVAQAVAKAHTMALDKVTYKLKSSLKKKKLKTEKLRDCIRRVEKDEDTIEVFTKGKGWSVKVEILLDKGSILAVLDCEKDKKEEKKTDAQGAKKEEVKATKE